MLSGLAFGFQDISVGAFYENWFLKRFGKQNLWCGVPHYRYMPIKALKLAHSHGIKFCPRAPDDKELIFNYLDAGVDGFETNNVPFIRQCCEEKGIELWSLPKN